MCSSNCSISNSEACPAFKPEPQRRARRRVFHYDPDRVSLTVAPFIDGLNGTATEHPNRRNTMLIDAMGDERASDTIDICDGKMAELMILMLLSRNRVSQIVRMCEEVRETGLFDDDTALQHEFKMHPQSGNPLLVQSKDFAKRDERTFDISHPAHAGRNLRVFGVTPQEGLDLPIIRSQFRSEAIRRGDDSKSEYILAPEVTSNPLYLWDYPEHMRAYIPGSSRGSQTLVHQNTRFVQLCLRRNGTAILGGHAWDMLSGKERVHVTTNLISYFYS